MPLTYFRKLKSHLIKINGLRPNSVSHQENRLLPMHNGVTVAEDNLLALQVASNMAEVTRRNART